MTSVNRPLDAPKSDATAPSIAWRIELTVIWYGICPAPGSVQPKLGVLEIMAGGRVP